MNRNPLSSTPVSKVSNSAGMSSFYRSAERRVQRPLKRQRTPVRLVAEHYQPNETLFEKDPPDGYIFSSEEEEEEEILAAHSLKSAVSCFVCESTV